jgi:uncharacterized membrane protein
LWVPEVDSGVGVDIVLLVGGMNVRENQWACLILVVRFCNTVLRYASPTLVLRVVDVVVWDHLGLSFVFQFELLEYY